MIAKKILFVVNVDWFFLSHRLPIAVEAQKRGYKVFICAIETNKRKQIESYGFEFFSLPTSRSGKNILNELKVMFYLYRTYKLINPDIVHHVGMKPVTYGSIIAKILKLPKVISALSGMGYLFINKNSNPIIHIIVLTLFKFGFRNNNLRVILQNEDDVKDIKKLRILKDSQIFLIKGSGIDLNLFDFSHMSFPKSESIRIILPARMLWDKGVGEFVEAARLLKSKYENSVEFFLIGQLDFENISSISENQLLKWQNEGCIKWLGFQENMKDIFVSSDIVVLPSYREGLPKSLIEACAIGRPIVTTDVPGCREVVKHGINGFLVPPKDFINLSTSIEKLIIDSELRRTMGLNSRQMAIEMFSINDVIDKTFFIYHESFK